MCFDIFKFSIGRNWNPQRVRRVRNWGSGRLGEVSDSEYDLYSRTRLEPYRRLLFNLPSSENDSDKLIFNSRLLEGCSGTLWPSQEGGSPPPQTPNMFLVYEVGDKLMGAAMLQLECWMLSAQPDAECCNLDAERSMLNGGCHRLDAACGMLDARCCMTHAACWTLDAECWTRLLIASCEISKLL
jgi:hypothetical protein